MKENSVILLHDGFILLITKEVDDVNVISHKHVRTVFNKYSPPCGSESESEARCKQVRCKHSRCVTFSRKDKSSFGVLMTIQNSKMNHVREECCRRLPSECLPSRKKSATYHHVHNRSVLLKRSTGEVPLPTPKRRKNAMAIQALRNEAESTFPMVIRRWDSTKTRTWKPALPKLAATYHHVHNRPFLLRKSTGRGPLPT